MSTLKKLVALAASLGLTFAGLAPVSADDLNPIPVEFRERTLTAPWVDPAWDVSKLWITYGALGGLRVMPGPAMVKNITTNRFCEAVDANCLKDGQSLWVGAYATFCQEKNQTPCIEKVEFRRSGDSQWTQAEFINYFDTTPSDETLELFEKGRELDPFEGKVRSISKLKRWSPDVKSGLLGSAPGPALVRAVGFESLSGHDTYLIEPYFVQFLTNMRMGKPESINWDTFFVNARPIAEVKSNAAHVGVEFIKQIENGEYRHSGAGVGGHRGEYFAVDGRYAFAAGWDPEVEMQISIRVPAELGGWFHSRMSGPNLSLKGVSKGVNLLTVSGASTNVPITYTAVRAFLPENKKYLDAAFGQDQYFKDTARANEAKGQGGLAGGSWDPNNGTADFELWFSQLDRRAKGNLSAWSIAKMPTQRLGDNRCMNKTDRVQGLINTNAMVYQSLIPEYKNGFLNYQVMGVHYDLNGEVFRGEYDLIMRSDAARCLYGFAKAPVSGKVTVVDSSGDTEVSTTTIGEKNGWLRLSAKNFTFSKKTIKVKLTQKKKTTITCVAPGKKVKKVTAANPKCPKGFKRR